MAFLDLDGLSRYDGKIKTYIENHQRVEEYDVVSQPEAGETSFPYPGEENKLYIAKMTNSIYRWDSTVSGYVTVGSGGGGGAEMTPATDTAPGTGGTVPAPPAGANTKFLQGNKTWSNPVTKTAIKSALASSATQTDKFLNENGEWVAVAIDDTNIVHTTGNETIAGTKSFTSNPSIKTNNSLQYMNFDNGKGTYAAVRSNSGATGMLSSNQMSFVEYSPKNTDDGTSTGYYELYSLPAASKGLAANSNYNVLTDKTPVTVAQGGTGATTAANARSNLGLGTSATVNTASSIAAGSTASTLPTCKAVATFVEGKGYLTSHQSLSGCVKTTGNQSMSGVVSITNTTASSSTSTGALKVSGGIGAKGNIYGAKVYGAVWNDYAECRQVNTLEPGFCVTETTSGMMVKSWGRLQPACRVTSDTYGACIGETDEAKTPVAIAGRVLVYPYSDISNFHLGDAVCSAPDGKVDVMTRDEIKEFPERIIGTVSEIPGYDVWYGGTKEDPKPIQVNGRIWIYVR